MAEQQRMSIRVASVSAILLVSLAYSAVPTFAQCCLGAQNSVTNSHDGRYRVEATSLTGTGHAVHGPYKFRFRTLRLNGEGEMEEIGIFEREWDTRNHFSMTICVSPTGNGFALSSSLEAPVHFFAPDGTILSSIDNHESQTIHWVRDGHPRLEYKLAGRTSFGYRTSKLWLPLFHIVGPESKWVSREKPSVIVEENLGFETVSTEELRWLMRMLRWRPEQGVRETSQVRSLIAESDESGLIALGLSALPTVEARLVMTEHPDLRRVQREIVRRLCGHRDAWRNLDLFVALLEHPNEELRACAQTQLRALLPNGEPTAEWINEHRPKLRWDPELTIYSRVQSN